MSGARAKIGVLTNLLQIAMAAVAPASYKRQRIYWMVPLEE